MGIVTVVTEKEWVGNLVQNKYYTLTLCFKKSICQIISWSSRDLEYFTILFYFNILFVVCFYKIFFSTQIVTEIAWICELLSWSKPEKLI